jgi:hypothetical protein
MEIHSVRQPLNSRWIKGGQVSRDLTLQKDSLRDFAFVEI